MIGSRAELLQLALGVVLVSVVNSIPHIDVKASNMLKPERPIRYGQPKSSSILSRRPHDSYPALDADLLLRLRGGISGQKSRLAGLPRENTMMTLKKYFSQLHLFPLTRRKDPKDSAGRTMLTSIKWKGVILGVASYAWVMLAWPGGEMELDGVAVPAARRCLALVLLVSFLWAFEAIPLHITSLLIPLLAVITGTLVAPAGAPALTPAKAAKEICSEFFNPTILLFLAGFSIGAALEKQKLSKLLAGAVLRPFGNRPDVLLLGMMLLGAFMSMWISNIPSSVLCTSLAQPILAQVAYVCVCVLCTILAQVARTHPHARTRARTHSRTRTHARTHARTRTHACMHSRTHARAHARTHACTRTHACIHAYARANTHARTHARTHAHKSAPPRRTHGPHPADRVVLDGGGGGGGDVEWVGGWVGVTEGWRA